MNGEKMQLIEGVKTRQLKKIVDERGYLMEMLRSDWPEFEKIAQVYLTACNPGYAKAWHYHKKQSDHFVCVKENAVIALYDMRDESGTKGLINEFLIGEKKPSLIKIPPFVAHGFRAEGKKTAFIVNIPTELYDYDKPDEFRLPFNDPSIKYDWKVKKGG